MLAPMTNAPHRARTAAAPRSTTLFTPTPTQHENDALAAAQKRWRRSCRLFRGFTRMTARRKTRKATAKPSGARRGHDRATPDPATPGPRRARHRRTAQLRSRLHRHRARLEARRRAQRVIRTWDDDSRAARILRAASTPITTADTASASAAVDARPADAGAGLGVEAGSSAWRRRSISPGCNRSGCPSSAWPAGRRCRSWPKPRRATSSI